MLETAWTILGLVVMAASSTPVEEKRIDDGEASIGLRAPFKSEETLRVFLDLPNNCDQPYDNLIAQLVDCKYGRNRGHPKLQYGCLFTINLKNKGVVCDGERSSGSDDDRSRRRPTSQTVVFPASTGEEGPWFPTLMAQPGQIPCKEGGPACHQAGVVWSSGGPANTAQDEDLPEVLHRDTPNSALTFITRLLSEDSPNETANNS